MSRWSHRKARATFKSLALTILDPFLLSHLSPNPLLTLHLPRHLQPHSESHCVSEWGPSFRPTYLKVARFAKEVNAQRVLCLTATATPSVVTDICDAEKGFDISVDQGVFKTGNYRSNLALQILPCVNRGAKLAALIPFLKARRGGASIIYITTQHESDELATSLKASGVDCKPYHAGMKAEDRKSTQDWFIAGEGVVVATIAFGMGIDKSNIRQVVHFNIPKTLENYS